MLNHWQSFKKRSVLFSLTLINMLNSLQMSAFFLTIILILFPWDALFWDIILFVLYIQKSKSNLYVLGYVWYFLCKFNITIFPVSLGAPWEIHINKCSSIKEFYFKTWWLEWGFNYSIFLVNFRNGLFLEMEIE